VLWPVSRPVTALDCALLKDISVVLAAVRGPEINSQRSWINALGSCMHDETDESSTHNFPFHFFNTNKSANFQKVR
jgi:hypothetical protein